MVEEKAMTYWEHIHGSYLEELGDRMLTVDSPSFDKENEMPWLNANQVELSIHQKRVFQKMLEMEQVHGIYVGKALFNKKFGILGDVPRSGKSFLLLCMVLYRPIVDNECLIAGVQRFRDFYSMTVYADESSFKQVKTNLIICHERRLSHFEKLMEQFVPKDKKVCVIETQQDVLDFMANYIDRVGEFDILVVAGLQAEHFVHGLNAHGLKPKFQRVIYDDADILSTGMECPARFTWFATSRVKNLRWPTGRVYGTQQIDGVHFSREIRRLFFTLEHRPHSWFLSTLIKCSPDLIRISMGLRRVKGHDVLCQDTPINELLRGVIPQDSIRALMNGDIEKSVELLGCATFPESENIVIMMTKQMYKDIDRLQAQIEQANTEIMLEESRDALIANCEAQIGELQKKIEYIRERVETTELCPISFDTIQTKTVVRCCGNVCDYTSIMQYLATNQENDRRQTCPFCRAEISPSQLMTVAKSAGSASSRLPTRNQALIQIFTDIFNQKPDAQVVYVTQEYDDAVYAYDRPIHELDTVFKQLPEGMVKLCEGSLESIGSGPTIFDMDLNNAVNFEAQVDNVLFTNRYSWRHKPEYAAKITDIVFSQPMDSEIEEDIIVRSQHANNCLFGPNHGIEMDVWRIQFKK